MPWTPFTADVIKTRLSARELQVYQETAEKEYPAEGGEAVLPEGAEPDARIDAIAAQVLAQFRGAILANPGLTFIGEAGTLPDFCHGYAAVVGRVAMMGLPPVEEGVTDPRREEWNAAMAFLKALPKMSPAVFTETEAAAETPSSCAAYGGKPLLDF